MTVCLKCRGSGLAKDGEDDCARCSGSGREPRLSKAVDGWAIVDMNGALHCFDHRLPVYWLKHVAEDELRKRTLQLGDRVVRIRVVHAAAKKGGAK